MKIKFYEFAKKKNSTKRPSSGTELDCHIDEPCSILRPVIKLNLGLDSAPRNLNYCHISEFNRYYYVTNWRFDHGCWFADLVSDPMASRRDDIGKQEFYVLRSSKENEDSLLDMAYPTEAGAFVTTNPFTITKPTGSPEAWTSTYSGGSYVIGIINNESEIGGAASYYTFKPFEFKAFLTAMLSDIDWMNVQDAELSESLLKVLYNPMEYIVSCMWFPFEVERNSTVPKIKFGFWELSAQAGTITKGIHTTQFKAEIPKHPQAESEFSYYNLSPFTRYNVFLLGFGEFPIDTTIAMNYKGITIETNIDLISGVGLAKIYMDGVDFAVAHKRALIGVPIQLASVMRNYVEMGSRAIGTGFAAVGSGNPFSAIGTIINGITSTIYSGIPQVETNGSNGTIVDNVTVPYIQAHFLYQTRINNANYGRPLCKFKKPSSIPGFILCERAHISTVAYDEEINEIDNYLNNGFFYE